MVQDEREQSTLSESIGSKLPTHEDGVKLYIEALQNFTEAEKIAELQPTPQKIEFFTIIGENKAKAGEPTFYELSYLEAQATAEDPEDVIWRRHAIYGLAAIQRESGKLDNAYTTVGLDEYYGHGGFSFDLQLARVQAEAGQDPLPTLQRASSHMGEVTAGSRNNLSIHFDPHHRVHQEENLIQTYLELDLPIPLDFPQRKDLLKNTQERMARRLLKNGEVDQALAIAENTGDSLLIAELATIASFDIKDKERVAQLQAIALDILSSNPHFAAIKAKRSELLALVARSYAKSGQDPTSLFQQALDIAGEITDSDLIGRAASYADIGKQQSLVGLHDEAANTFTLAEETVRTMLPIKDSFQTIEYAEYSIYMEDTILTMVEGNEYDLAKQKMQELLDYEHYAGDPDLFRVKVLSRIASLQALQSLTPEQKNTFREDQARDARIVTHSREMAQTLDAVAIQEEEIGNPQYLVDTVRATAQEYQSAADEIEEKIGQSEPTPIRTSAKPEKGIVPLDADPGLFRRDTEAWLKKYRPELTEEERWNELREIQRLRYKEFYEIAIELHPELQDLVAIYPVLPPRPRELGSEFNFARMPVEEGRLTRMFEFEEKVLTDLVNSERLPSVVKDRFQARLDASRQQRAVKGRELVNKFGHNPEIAGFILEIADVRIIDRWIAEEQPIPVEIQRRLETLEEISSLINDKLDEDRFQQWLLVYDDNLDDSPANAIREGKIAEVISAANKLVGNPTKEVASKPFTVVTPIETKPEIAEEKEKPLVGPSMKVVEVAMDVLERKIGNRPMIAGIAIGEIEDEASRTRAVKVYLTREQKKGDKLPKVVTLTVQETGERIQVPIDYIVSGPFEAAHN